MRRHGEHSLINIIKIFTQLLNNCLIYFFLCTYNSSKISPFFLVAFCLGTKQVLQKVVPLLIRAVPCFKDIVFPRISPSISFKSLKYQNDVFPSIKSLCEMGPLLIGVVCSGFKDKFLDILYQVYHYQDMLHQIYQIYHQELLAQVSKI